MSNFQHIVAENVGPPPGFNVATNLMYDLSPDYALQQVDVPTQPHPMHIWYLIKSLMVQKNLIIHIDEEGPQFTLNLIKF